MRDAPRQPAGTALITGASSGIGEALAVRFAAGGYDLVLVARRADRLRALAARLESAHRARVWVATADLSRPDAAARLAASMKRARRPIDVLVNNAGVLAFGGFVDMKVERHREMIDLNVGGLTQMLAHFVPPMVARGKGRVLNVASIASFQPVPTLATYAATKAYVLSLTESLSQELQGTGVTVTALCPGITATDMLHRARSESVQLASLPEFIVGDADAVAAEGVEACLAGEVIRVPGLVNQATTLASRVTPRWLLRRVAGAVARRLG
jgi:hypothetical protein